VAPFPQRSDEGAVTLELDQRKRATIEDDDVPFRGRGYGRSGTPCETGWQGERVRHRLHSEVGCLFHLRGVRSRQGLEQQCRKRQSHKVLPTSFGGGRMLACTVRHACAGDRLPRYGILISDEKIVASRQIAPDV